MSTLFLENGNLSDSGKEVMANFMKPLNAFLVDHSDLTEQEKLLLRGNFKKTVDDMIINFSNR